MKLFIAAIILVFLTGCWGDNRKEDSSLQKQDSSNVQATMKSKQPSNYNSVRTDGRRTTIKVKTTAAINTPLIVYGPPAPEPEAAKAPMPPSPSQLTEEEKTLNTKGKANSKESESSETESGMFYVMKYGAYALYLVCIVGGAIAMKIFYGKEIALAREGAVVFKDTVVGEVKDIKGFIQNILTYSQAGKDEHTTAQKIKLKLETLEKLINK